jgi:hypothetical protein
VRRPFQSCPVVSPGLADIGVRRLLISSDLFCLSLSGVFRCVAFTNPFTAHDADLGLLRPLVFLVAAVSWAEVLGPGPRSDES